MASLSHRSLSHLHNPFLPVRHASSTSHASPSRTDQTLPLPCGRTLGYAEYGSPAGYPLIYFHGFPASRLEATGIHDLASRNDRLRIIAPDRPGFGLSSPQPGRRIVDWPGDVEALAEHLELERFAVLGGSGGGPYALACARALPGEMMSSVGIMAGAPPWAAGSGEVLRSSKVMAALARRWPGGPRGMTDGVIAGAKWLLGMKFVERRIDAWLEKAEQAKDNEEGLSTEERRKELLRSLFEGFAQGSGAMVEEARLLTERYWGFRCEDIKYPGIQFWHGSKDMNAPVRMIRWMVERIPGSVLHESDDTHFTLANRLEEILKTLVSEADWGTRSSETPLAGNGANKGGIDEMAPNLSRGD